MNTLKWEITKARTARVGILIIRERDPHSPVEL